MKKLRKFKKKIFNKEKLSLWAKKVKARDRYSCIACGYTGYLHSHHILPKSIFPNYAFEVWNGATLCKRCHLGKNGVHGKHKARNSDVKHLRELMFSKDTAATKMFIKNKIPKQAVKYRPYVKRVRPKRKLKRTFKRKLY